MSADGLNTSLGWLPLVDTRPAVIEPGRGTLSYAGLDRLADETCERLRRVGVRDGARVGLYLRRSCDAVAAILGVLRAGCSYVPVDPRAPVERVAETHLDCRVQTTIVEDRFQAAYRDALNRLGGDGIALQCIRGTGGGGALARWATFGEGAERLHQGDDDSPTRSLACILYTSGTTSQPKGWMMSRTAIEAHASWARRALDLSRYDTLANHAQFNFGMSLFDIFSALTCGATLVLVPDAVRQDAKRVVEMIARQRVSIWFSAPVILSRIGQTELAGAGDLSTLRVVAFAGEVFPAAQLSALRRRVPHPRYFNFYGSTETNVAAYYEIPSGHQLEAPAPMGRICEHYEARVVDVGGRVSRGAAGELHLRGAGLSTGYWNQPELTADRLSAESDGGEPWFRTCDLVREMPTGDLYYVGRIGRMVKVRGYRVEPGEIEARLYQHSGIREVSVTPDGTSGAVRLVAHLSTVTGEPISAIELREFCAAKLPAYMIPERFEFHDDLPRTSRGKINLHDLRGAPECETTHAAQ